QALAGTGVTVNCVLAGPTMSDGVLAMWDNIYPGLSRAEQEARFIAEGRAAGSLLGRVIRPEEIAHLVTYLSSDFASATTGRALGADGGLVSTIIPYVWLFGMLLMPRPREGGRWVGDSRRPCEATGGCSSAAMG